MTAMPMMSMPMPTMMSGMPSPMMPMMMPMPMGMGMPMGGAMPMMGMNAMNPMMGPMMMPMPLMCQCTVEMTKDGMVCKMMPMDGTSMEAMAERCSAMNAMMTMGMPMMMACGGMPMMMCMPAQK